MAEDPSAKDADKKTDDNKGDDNLGDAGKRALERERQARRDAEARLRELEPLAAKAQELEDAKKSGEQKLSEEIKSLKDDLAKQRHLAMVAEVAREKGLTPAQARYLSGTTKEDVEIHADGLITSFGGKKAEEAGGDKDKDKDAGDKNNTEREKDRGDPARRPKEKLRSGAVTDDDDKQDDFDPEKVADAVRARRF